MLLTPIEDLMPRHGGKILEAAERYHPTQGRLFGISLDEGYQYTTNNLIGMMADERAIDARTLPMSQEEWEASPYRREGIEWQEGMTEGRAKLWADEYDIRAMRKNIIEAGKMHYGMVGSGVSFFGQLLGNIPDPINLIPVGGGIIRGAGIAARVIKGSRVAALATKAGLPALAGRVAESAVVSKLAQSQLGRLATSQTGRAVGAGMLEGAAGTALADAFVLPALAERGEDVGFVDAAFDIAFGGIIGGGMGLLGDVLGRGMRNAATARKLRDAARRATTAEDRVNVVKSQELAVSQFMNGEEVNISPVLKGTGSAERINRAALAEVLARGENVDVDFGKLRPEYKEALNAIRTDEGVPLFVDDNLLIPGAVVKKLHEEGILKDGMSADDVAQMLLDIFHGDADFASSTRRTHIQAIGRFREKLMELGFIAIDPKTGRPVVKSAYLEKIRRLESRLGKKESPRGDAHPSHTVDDLARSPVAAARLSALQGPNRTVIKASPEVNYSTPIKPDYPEAPKISERSAGVLEDMDIDANTGMSAAEAQLEAMRTAGLIGDDQLDELIQARAEGEAVQRWAETGAGVAACIARK